MADLRRPNSFGDEAAVALQPGTSLRGAAPTLPAAAAPLPMLTQNMAKPPVQPPAAAGPTTLGRMLSVGASSVTDGLRNLYRSPAGNSFGDAASPDFSQAMTGNPALIAANAAPPASASPLAPSPVTLPATQSQVRAVDNQPTSLAAMGAPLAAPPSYQAAGGVTEIGGVGSAARTAQMERDTAATRGLADRSMELAQQGVGQATPGLAVMGNPGPGAAQEFFDNANLRNAAAQGSWSPRRGFQGNDAAVAAAAAPVQQRARLRELSLQNEGRMGEARLRDATDRRGQDVAAQTSRLRDATDRRGQDITQRGQDVSAGTAGAKLAYETAKDNRQYQLDVAKLGAEQAGKLQAQRDSSRKSVETQVAGMIPPGPDGKPDTAAAAQHMAGLNNLVAQRQQQLQAQLAKTPDRADVKAELAALEKDPFGALGQDNIRKYIVGQQVASTAKQTGTGQLTPWGTNAANSTAPVTSLRPDKGILGTDYVTTRADGSTDIIPGRYLRENGKLNQDLNILMQR